jgi:sec-independent protein translocase protein TatB
VFDIGFWELLLIFGLGLIVLGPERLPRVAAQLGNWAGQARRMANMLMTQLRHEIDLEDRPKHPMSPQPGQAQPSWSRPGVDDLKPGHGAAKAPVDDAGAETTASPADAAPVDSAPVEPPAAAANPPDRPA